MSTSFHDDRLPAPAIKREPWVPGTPARVGVPRHLRSPEEIAAQDREFHREIHRMRSQIGRKMSGSTTLGVTAADIRMRAEQADAAAGWAANAQRYGQAA